MYASQTQSMAAKVVGAAGQDLSGVVGINWTSLDQSIVTVSSSSGNSSIATARAIGTTRVVAALIVGGKADTITVSVVLDSRSLVRTLNIVPDTVTFDATTASFLDFEYRVSNGNGTEQCQAGPALGFRFNTAMITLVQTSANAAAVPTCRMRLAAITGQPGGSWLYASVNSVTDSVFVNINRIAFTARFTTLPTVTATTSTILAGDTVQYGVTVLNEAGVPAPGVSVGFDVSGGSLSARSVTTNASGVATVQWFLPFRTTTGALIPAAGTAHTINFRMEFTSGATSALTASNPIVLPGPAVRVALLGNFSALAFGPNPAVDTLFPTAGTQCTAATCSQSLALGLTPATANVSLYAQSFDRFGNPRTTAATFSSNDPAAISGVTATGTQLSTTLQGDRARTDTVTATDGTGSASIQVKWTAGTPIVFQPVASNQLWTGQAPIFTLATGIPGDVLVYNGGSGTAAYPTNTLVPDTLAFAWTNGGFIDVGLLTANGNNSGAPISTIPLLNRASATWGFAGFQTAGSQPAGAVAFISDRDARKNATTGLANLSATATGYARAVGDFTLDGFQPGQVVLASGFGNAANNGVSTITNITALTLTVTKTPTTVVEAAPGVNTRLIRASNIAGAANPSVWDLYILNRNGNTVSKVTSTSSDSTHIRYRGISISPSGLKALIVSDNFAGGGGIPARPSQVYEVTLLTGAITALTNNTNAAVIYRYAGYAPSGTKIYLDVNDNGTREVVEKDGNIFTILKTGGQIGTGLDVGPSFDLANPASLGFVLNNVVTQFTLPAGASASGRRNVQWFTWMNR